jgi:hypothetical protein
MILSQKVPLLSQLSLGQDKCLITLVIEIIRLNLVPILNGTSNINHLRHKSASPISFIGKKTNLIYREPGTNGESQ